MSKKKRRVKTEVVVLGLNESSPARVSSEVNATDPVSESKLERLTGYLKAHWIAMASIVFVLFLGLGVMAKNGWLPSTDSVSGKRTGWFGKEISKNAPSSWNPLAPPLPSSTTELSKEYIHAGGRLLASVDSGATEIPPEDLAVWRPSDGTWRIVGQATPTPFGTPGDTPVQGDYDGDGKTDFSVVRPNPSASPSPGSLTWYVIASSGSTISPVVFGIPGDLPVVADYDGDSKTDIAVYRPSNYNWYIRPSSDPSNMLTLSIANSTSTDVAAPADYDGDGKADIALWRNSDTKFYWKNSSDDQSHSTNAFGYSGDVPVCADYDGDGNANFALRHNDDWIIMHPAINGTTNTINWPYSGGTPVPNDYDGDGLVDIAVWKIVSSGSGKAVGTWYIRQSSATPQLRQVNWGANGDIPVPALYRR